MCLFLSDQVNRLIWTTYLSVCLNDRRGFDGGRGSGGRGVALHLEWGGEGLFIMQLFDIVILQIL